MTTDVPLICDDPNADSGFWVVSVSEPLKREQVQQLRERIEWFLKRPGPDKVMVLQPGMTIRWVEKPRREWPGAEFCAA